MVGAIGLEPIRPLSNYMRSERPPVFDDPEVPLDSPSISPEYFPGPPHSAASLTGAAGMAAGFEAPAIHDGGLFAALGTTVNSSKELLGVLLPIVDP